jgi:hypothetical protein
MLAVHLRNTKLPAKVQANTMHAPAIWIESLSARVEPPERTKNIWE